MMANKLEGELLEDVSLAPYSTWKTGGKAKRLFKPANKQDLANFIKTLDTQEPIRFLGLGSNILVRDGGYDGTVIMMQGALKQLEQIDERHLYAEAGVSCGQLARFSARSGLRKLEFLAGVPGTVGGALAMNAGCHGGETWDQVVSVEVLTRAGDIIQRTPEEFQIKYRSVQSSRAEEWFLSATFIAEPGTKQDAMAEIKELLDYRNSTQPTNMPSCGSVFRNPPGDHAARLIESCGLKGQKIGGAMVSPKHANFIVNDGAATAAQLEKLLELVRSTVQEQTGVSLIHEVHIFGNP